MATIQQVQPQPVPTWKTVVTVLCLLFFFPLGILFMFLWMRWPSWVKILLSAGIVLFIPAVIVILAAVVVLAINPVELTKNARDAQRLTDLANIQVMMNTAMETSSGTTWLCNDQPGSCNGVSTSVESNQSNGKGWVKVNFDKLGIRLPESTSTKTIGFPVDPVNSDIYSYRYCFDGKNWEIDTKLESTKYVNKMTTDGGDSNDFYEVGSDLTVCK